MQAAVVHSARSRRKHIKKLTALWSSLTDMIYEKHINSFFLLKQEK